MPPGVSNTRQAGGGSHSELGGILVELGIITQNQLEQAVAATTGERDLAKTLVEMGFTTEEKIMKGIGVKATVPYFTSLEGLYTAESGNIISEELARRLQEFVKGRLAMHKYPRRVVFKDSLPKNDRGKIDRKSLQ